MGTKDTTGKTQSQCLMGAFTLTQYPSAVTMCEALLWSGLWTHSRRVEVPQFTGNFTLTKE